MYRQDSPQLRLGTKNGTATRTRFKKKKGKRTDLFFLWGAFGVAILISLTAMSALPEPIKTSERPLPDSGLKLSQQETPLKQRQNSVEESAAEVNAAREDKDDVEYYMVFSTACSAFQDWQSFVFFYYALKVKQPGHVIRIASGCSDEKIEALKEIHEERIKPMSDRFHVHFTPNFAGEGKKEYKYNNKPFGLRHFLENFLGYPEKKDAEDAIIIIVDPDQMLLKPITNDFSSDSVIWHVGVDKVDGTKRPRTRVTHGAPFGQVYGYGAQPWRTLNMKYIAGEDSPAALVSNEDAAAYYPAGPPYLATVRDMYNIVMKWTEFMPRVREGYSGLLGEMFGYSIAAAHLKLPHQLAESFMVSEPGSGSEGWPAIDAIPSESACDPDAIPTESLPYVLHYCQNYCLGKWFIGKYRLDVNFFSCEAPLLTEPPSDVALPYDYCMRPGAIPYGTKEMLKPRQVKHNAWMLCRMIAALNEVAIYFKKNYCDETANFEKTYVFGPNRTEYDSKMDMWGEHHNKKPKK